MLESKDVGGQNKFGGSKILGGQTNLGSTNFGVKKNYFRGQQFSGGKKFWGSNLKENNYKKLGELLNLTRLGQNTFTGN